MPLQADSHITMRRYGAVMIDPDSPVPPYRQVAAILRARIESGQIPVRLPGERSIADELGVAIGTARKAVAVLRDEEDLVETIPGWGTFVKGKRPPPRNGAAGGEEPPSGNG